MVRIRRSPPRRSWMALGKANLVGATFTGDNGPDQAIPWPRFALWLSMLIHRHGRNILRLKGLIDIEGVETPVVVHGVQHIIHRPLHLAAWPDGIRRTRIVGIGESLDRDLMQRSFVAFNLNRQVAISA